MANLNAVAEAMRQVANGEDFWSADTLTRDLSPESACKIPDGCPYSIATQVAHMLVWQDHWLDQIQGQPVKDVSDAEDFPSPALEDWTNLRGRLVAGIDLASSISAGIDVDRSTGQRTVGDTLLKIAIHNAYHIGQIALIRQVGGMGMPTYQEGN